MYPLKNNYLPCSTVVLSSSTLEVSDVDGKLVLLIKSSVCLASKDVGADTMS